MTTGQGGGMILPPCSLDGIPRSQTTVAAIAGPPVSWHPDVHHYNCHVEAMNGRLSDVHAFGSEVPSCAT